VAKQLAYLFKKELTSKIIEYVKCYDFFAGSVLKNELERYTERAMRMIPFWRRRKKSVRTTGGRGKTFSHAREEKSGSGKSECTKEEKSKTQSA
jgi:hypothetical protein